MITRRCQNNHENDDETEYNEVGNNGTIYNSHIGVDPGAAVDVTSGALALNGDTMITRRCQNNHENDDDFHDGDNDYVTGDDVGDHNRATASTIAAADASSSPARSSCQRQIFNRISHEFQDGNFLGKLLSQEMRRSKLEKRSRGAAGEGSGDAVAE